MAMFDKYDRFEMEQDILKMWGVGELLDEVMRLYCNDPATASELKEKLTAVKHVLDLQAMRLFNGFETMLRDNLILYVPDWEETPKPKKGKKK